MGQYTSRITNNNPSAGSRPRSTSSSSTSLNQTNSESSLDQLPDDISPISSNPLNHSIRRRRSSTYNNSSLPNPRRRRIPRLNDTIRFWQRRNQQQQQQHQQFNNEGDIDENSDDMLSSFMNELETDSNQSPPNTTTTTATATSDPLDISNLAGLASNILSSHRSSQHHHTHQNTGHINDSNSSNSSNSMSFEHQTEMLSRLLEIAATSTVSNLMGSSQVNGRRFDNTSRSTNQTVLNDNINTIEANGYDSSFQEFVRALRHGLLTNELSERYGNDGNIERLNNMTFFRAFRFDSETSGNTTSNSATTTTTTDTSNNGNDNNDNENNDETNDNSVNTTNDVNNPNVPVMIIGVRSVANTQGLHDFNDNDSSNRSNLNRTDSSNTIPNQSANQTNDTEDRAEPTNEESSDDSSTVPTTQQRSWVIFVMGNTFAWNHPLLSAPSLMSENPTYEDLLNLQELIGQVKPQVTTKEELNDNKDQLYELVLDQQDSQTSNHKKWTFTHGERCQICLEDFNANEIVRSLKNCNHFYHQPCIDHWLLNGKNNCPLCRSKGIVNLNAEERETETETGMETTN